MQHASGYQSFHQSSHQQRLSALRLTFAMPLWVKHFFSREVTAPSSSLTAQTSQLMLR